MIYVIADLHLGTAVDKPMTVFGGVWEGHDKKIAAHWNALVKPEDTVFIPGDVSWGMLLSEALDDFSFLHALPGQKILSKGNHDYWWATVSKMQSALEQRGLTSLRFLYNNAYLIEGKVFCGTKGYLWDAEESESHNRKMLARECARLELSLREGQKLQQQAGHSAQPELIALLHYPPVTVQTRNDAMMDLLHRYGVRRCYYGHIHGPGHRSAVMGEYEGMELSLISADYLGFHPMVIK